MFLGCTFAIGLLPPSELFSAGLISAATLVVLVGLLDDRFELSPYARLTAHVVAATLVLVSSKLSITTLGNPFGSEEVAFGPVASAAFTCVAVVGAINAFNMLDGMDGLAGTMAFVSLVSIAILAGMIGDFTVASVSIVICSGVAAFLIFNIPARFNRRFRCFMETREARCSDSCWHASAIVISQGDGMKVSPTTTLWMVALPLYELLWTTIRRLLRGHSPFRPDRAHFHHKLLDAGFGVRGAFFRADHSRLDTRHRRVAHSLTRRRQFHRVRPVAASGLGTVVLMHHAEVLWRVVPNRFRRTGVAEVL
jgi:UDP-GlcNAc:undecaprenyl-phosphate GlcNAc-1-phosphate transferase